MKKIKRDIKIILPNRYKLNIIIKSHRYSSPSQAFHCEAIIEIRVPMDKKRKCVVYDLCYGNNFFGQELCANWGLVKTGKDYVVKYFPVFANTWNEAESEALKIIKEQTKNLSNLISERMRDIERAEK